MNMQRINSRGFTLIELLVVITIIAILMAIIFPVLSKARDRAYQAQCINNMRQMIGATLMYAQDNNNKYPAADKVWNLLNMPSKSLICPAYNSKRNGYGYNYYLGEKAIADSMLPNESDRVVVADSTANLNVLESGADLDFRHSDKCIIGYADGHAAGTDNKNIDFIYFSKGDNLISWYEGIPYTQAWNVYYAFVNNPTANVVTPDTYNAQFYKAPLLGWSIAGGAATTAASPDPFTQAYAKDLRHVWGNVDLHKPEGKRQYLCGGTLTRTLGVKVSDKYIPAAANSLKRWRLDFSSVSVHHDIRDPAVDTIIGGISAGMCHTASTPSATPVAPSVYPNGTMAIEVYDVNSKLIARWEVLVASDDTAQKTTTSIRFAGSNMIDPIVEDYTELMAPVQLGGYYAWGPKISPYGATPIKGYKVSIVCVGNVATCYFSDDEKKFVGAVTKTIEGGGVEPTKPKSIVLEAPNSSGVHGGENFLLSPPQEQIPATKKPSDYGLFFAYQQ